MNLGAIQQRALTFWRSGKKKIKPYNGPMKHVILRGANGRSCPICATEMVHYSKIMIDHTMPEAATIEHILPRALGGKNEEKNLTTICNGCNRARGLVFSDQINSVNSAGIRRYVGWLFLHIEDPIESQFEFPAEHRRFSNHWRFHYHRNYVAPKPEGVSTPTKRRRAVNMSASARRQRPTGGV